MVRTTARLPLLRARPRLGQALLAPALLGLLLGVLACENQVDDTPNYLVADSGQTPDSGGTDLSPQPGDLPAGSETTIGPDGDVAPVHPGPCAKCFSVGDVFRFTLLEVEELSGAGYLLRVALSGVWAIDIDKAELNILLEVAAIEGEEVSFRILNGARTIEKCDGAVCCANGVCKGDELCVIQGNEAIMVEHYTADGMAMKPEDKTSLHIYAGSAASPKNCSIGNQAFDAIHVSDILATMTCDDACALGGKVDGALSKKAIHTTCTCLVLDDKLADEACGKAADDFADGECDGCGTEWSPLSSLVLEYNSKQDLDYTCANAGGEPAACVKAAFTAVKLEKTPPPCN